MVTSILQEKGRTRLLAFSSRIIKLFEIVGSSKTCGPYNQTVSICIRALLLSMAEAFRLSLVMHTLTRYLYSSQYDSPDAASFARGSKVRAAWLPFCTLDKPFARVDRHKFS